MRTRCCGQLQQRAEQRGDVAPAGLRRAAHALHDGVARLGLVGEAVDRRRRTASGSVSAQLSRNAARSPSTAGPWMRKCVSRHSRLVAGVALPLVGDADAAGERRPPRRRSAPCGGCGGSPGPSRSRRSGRNQRTLHAGALHVVDELRVDRVGAPRVEQHAHPHAGLRALARAARANSRADLALPVDEGQEVDRVLGARRSPRASPGRSRRRCAARRCGCPRSPARRSRLRACAARARVDAVAHARHRCHRAGRRPAAAVGCRARSARPSPRPAAPARRPAPPRAARRPPRRRARRSTRAAPRAAARRCRRAARRSRRTTCSTRKNRPSAERDRATTAARDTDAPNASHDHAGWWRRGDQPEQQRHRAPSSAPARAATGRPPRRRPRRCRRGRRRPRCPNASATNATHAERRRRVSASTSARPYFCTRRPVLLDAVDAGSGRVRAGPSAWCP